MKHFFLIFSMLVSINIFSAKSIDNIVLFKVIVDKGVSQSNLDILNASIESNLSSLGYGIINEKVQNEALEEQKKQQNSDCYDGECLVDTGRMLAAKKLLIIRITKQENKKFFIKIQNIDIESGIIEKSFASSESLNFKEYELINKLVVKILNKTLIKKKTQTKIESKIDTNKTRLIKVSSIPENVDIYNHYSISNMHHLGVTPKSIKIYKGENKKIYLSKYGYEVKEYILKYDSEDEVNIELKKLAKYKLVINTKVNYKISYSSLPVRGGSNKVSTYNQHVKGNKLKYFKGNSKEILLTKGRYNLVLKKKGYATVYKTVNLNKDLELDIKDKKEVLLIGRVDLLSESKVFYNVDNIDKYQFHSGFILSLLTMLFEEGKLDLFSFGFLTDFKSEDSLKNFKFSLFNAESSLSKNIYYSITLYYILGEGDIYTNKDDTISTPFGVKIGYKKRFLKDKMVFKAYQKTDIIKFVNTSSDKSGVILTFGLSLGYLF